MTRSWPTDGGPGCGDLFRLLPSAGIAFPPGYSTCTGPAPPPFPILAVLPAGTPPRPPRTTTRPPRSSSMSWAASFRPSRTIVFCKGPRPSTSFTPAGQSQDTAGKPVVTVADPLGRLAMSYDYNLVKARVQQASMEAGARWMLNNAVGKPIRLWDGRGFMRAISYDALQRPAALNVTDASSKSILAEKTIYGDSNPGGPVIPRWPPTREGRSIAVYDGAGVVTNLGLNPDTNQNEGYDFREICSAAARALLRRKRLADDGRLEPEPAHGRSLHRSGCRFDAMNRVIQQVAAHKQQPAGDQSQHRPAGLQRGKPAGNGGHLVAARRRAGPLARSNDGNGSCDHQ